MWNSIKNLYHNYKAARVASARYHVSSIVSVIAILVVLGIALMYTEVLNNSVFVDMPGVCKVVRMPRVNAVLGTVGSWLGVPNINDALLLVIIGCITLLVAIFILKVAFGGYVNMLFLAVFGYVGRICYKAMINYQMGADMLYENNLLGIHIMRILTETERLNTINQAVEAFFTKYEINEGVILTNVTPSDILHLCEITDTLQTKQQIITAVADYLKENHMNFELYPSLQQEQEVSSLAWVNELLYNTGAWCYAHPVLVVSVMAGVCVTIWYFQGGYYGASVNKLAEGMGDNLTNTNQVVNNSTANVSEAHKELMAGLKETLSEIRANKQQVFNCLAQQQQVFEVKLQAQNDVINGLKQELHQVKEEAHNIFHLLSSQNGCISHISKNMSETNSTVNERFETLTKIIKHIYDKI